ncbi:MAG: YbhN family protein [Gordonia sp. (in: high G+C Gram-positive bacteria)]
MPGDELERPEAAATLSSDHPQPKKPKAWRRWLRWILILVVIAMLTAELVYFWPNVEQAGRRIDDLYWGWVVAAVVCAMLSMDSYAQVQRALMRSAGVRVKQQESLAVILASNSFSQTMPGGQVIAPAFIYRESRKWGASPVVASWQLVMSGLLAGAGLAILGLGGALLAGAKTNPFSVLFSVAGFVVFVVIAQYLAAHPESIEGIGARVLGWVNKLRDKPADTSVDALNRTLTQLRAVHLNRKDASIAFGWSLFNWVADVACLGFACWAIGSHPSISALMVAYAAGKAVGTAIPLLPGGLGVVDVVLVSALTSAGMVNSDALTSVVIYRIISFLLVTAVGWVVIALRYRSELRTRTSLEEEMLREEEQIASPPGGEPEKDEAGRNGDDGRAIP